MTLICWLAPLLCLAGGEAVPNEVEPPDRGSKPKATSAAEAADSLSLRSGETVRGTVVNESLHLRTAYASLLLPRRLVSMIEFGSDPLELTMLSTANSNRFSGFLEDESFTVDQTNRQTEVRRDAVASVILGGKPADWAVKASVTWVRLKNGDLLSGVLGEEVFPSADLEVMRASPQGQGEFQFHMRDGSVRSERLPQTHLTLDLEVGSRVDLPIVAIEALSRSRTLACGQPPTAAPANPMNRALAGSTNLDGFVWIPPGQFTMGSPYNERGRDLDEGPQTLVSIPQGFWMGRCEVTQAEYEKVMGVNPSSATDSSTLPVEKVSWTEAMDYCDKLTRLAATSGTLPTNWVFRLPTEAEWEYACRAGTTTRFSCGDDPTDSLLPDYAWLARNSEFRTHPVGTRKPNPWGLHDMHGNVWEWCLDRWERTLQGGNQTNSAVVPSGGLRVARGGSWLYDAKACRSANRDDYSPSNRCSDIGFRVVLAPAAP